MSVSVNHHIEILAAKQLGKRDHEPNPDAIYCFKLKRNPCIDGKQHQRTPFNSDKTKLLRPQLYEKLKDDDTISFCYTDDVTKAKYDYELLNDLKIHL